MDPMPPSPSQAPGDRPGSTRHRPAATGEPAGSRSRALAFLEAWTEPSPELDRPEDRRRARMLSALVLVLIVAGALSSTVIYYMAGPDFGGIGYQVNGVHGSLIGMAAVPLLCVAYLLSRSRHYRVGAWFTVAVTLVLAWVSAMASAWTNHDYRTVVYLAVPMLLAGALLDARSTLTVAGASVAGTATIAFVVPGASYGDVHPGIVFLVMLAGLILVFATVRGRDLDQLAHQAEELVRAQEIARIGSWSLDPATGRVWWSEAMYQVHGRDPRDPVETLEDALRDVLPADRDRIHDALSQAIEDPVPGEHALPVLEFRIQRPDGEERYLEGQGRVAVDARRRVHQVEGTVRDVTDRKRLERKFEDLVEAAPDAIILVDARGRIVLVNQQTEEVFGYERSELLGQAIEVLIPERFRDAHVGHRQRYMDDPSVRPMGVGLDLQGVRKDDTEFPVEVSLSPLMTDEGPRVMAAVRDSTEREAFKEELRRYAQRLERSNRDWEQFAYVVSHDLQEPIRMVHSYLQLLERRYHGSLGEDASEYIEYAMEGALRMRELINGLLEYSRVDTQAGPVEAVGAEEVLDGVLHLLHVAVEERDAEITYDDLPTVLVDRTQLAQLFQNLLANALKFTPGKRRPHVHVSAHRTDDMWEFEVSDNGIGIDKDHADRIFVIFQRLHSRGQYEGQGIGLAVCKKIVERHGGRIWVQSPGTALGGTTFHFTLPDAEAPRNALAEEAREALAGPIDPSTRIGK